MLVSLFSFLSFAFCGKIILFDFGDPLKLTDPTCTVVRRLIRNCVCEAMQYSLHNHGRLVGHAICEEIQRGNNEQCGDRLQRTYSDCRRIRRIIIIIISRWIVRVVHRYSWAVHVVFRQQLVAPVQLLDRNQTTIVISQSRLYCTYILTST